MKDFYSYVCTIQFIGYNFCCSCKATVNYSMEGALAIKNTVILALVHVKSICTAMIMNTNVITKQSFGYRFS